MALATALACGASELAICPTAPAFCDLGSSIWFVDWRERAAMDAATRRPSYELLLICFFSLLSRMPFCSVSFVA